MKFSGKALCILCKDAESPLALFIVGLNGSWRVFSPIPDSGALSHIIKSIN